MRIPLFVAMLVLTSGAAIAAAPCAAGRLIAEKQAGIPPDTQKGTRKTVDFYRFDNTSDTKKQFALVCEKNKLKILYISLANSTNKLLGDPFERFVSISSDVYRIDHKKFSMTIKDCLNAATRLKKQNTFNEMGLNIQCYFEAPSTQYGQGSAFVRLELLHSSDD